MSRVLITSYANVSRLVTGRARRTEALLAALGPGTILCQPPPAHPRVQTILLGADFGRHKVGINWGIFNFFWPPNATRVRAALRGLAPRAVIMSSIWEYHAVRHAQGIPLFLDAHNVDAVAIGERFGPSHPFTRMVHRCELRALQASAHVFTCSENDRALFQSRYGIPSDRITAVPNGVAVSEFDPDAAPAAARIPEKPGPVTLFFMGKLDYQPNREALRVLCERVLPKLEQAAPGRFHLLVCGGPIPQGAFPPSVHFAGRVEAVAPFLWSADICLAPIFSGSGTRFKVLEYFAARKPVVATAKAVEGLDVVPGEHYEAAETEQFADRILELDRDPARAGRLAQAAFTLARERYDWSVVQPRWRRIMELHDL